MEVRISGAAVDKVGGRICDSPVPEPVGGGSEGHTLRADVEREDLTNDDPGDWAPGGSEEGDVDTHEGDEDFLAGEIRKSAELYPTTMTKEERKRPFLSFLSLVI